MQLFKKTFEDGLKQRILLIWQAESLQWWDLFSRGSFKYSCVLLKYRPFQNADVICKLSGAQG